MGRIRRHFLASWGLAFVIGLVLPVCSAQVSISPVVIEIDMPRRPVAISVTNSGGRPIRLQAEVLLWQQTDGKDRYEPSDALLVVPSIVDVPANSTQVFRVVLRSPVPSPVERTYRLVLDDITEEKAEGGGASISFKFTHNLPVMIAPSGKVLSTMRWKPCAETAETSIPVRAAHLKQACVRLLNTGNRRIRVQTLVLSGDGWEQALSYSAGENVLVGSERELRVQLKPGQTGAVSGVQVFTGLGETLKVESGRF